MEILHPPRNRLGINFERWIIGKSAILGDLWGNWSRNKAGGRGGGLWSGGDGGLWGEEGSGGCGWGPMVMMRVPGGVSMEI